MVLTLLVLLLIPVLFYILCCIATYPKSMLPDYIKTKLHDDWIGPLRRIPRIWTSFVLAMPPGKFLGNTAEEDIIIKDIAYPVASDVKVIRIPGVPLTVKGYSPVPKIGHWHILNCKFFSWLFRIPCFFAASWRMSNQRYHCNFGVKPDVTDLHWGFPEASFTRRDLHDDEK